MEGFITEKERVSKSSMSSDAWHVMCMQQVCQHVSQHHVDDNGFLFVFSSLDLTDAAGHGNAHASVAFIVSLKKSMIGFMYVSARTVAVLFKIQWGSCTFICAHAPTSRIPIGFGVFSTRAYGS